MHTSSTHHRHHAAARSGFTLVEMLVATTLVVMMMLMFAQIYVAAIGSLGEQQAVARNDGKARLAEQLLRGDLQRASFRSELGSNQGIVPLVHGDNVQQYQKGFFYLSENDQTNPVDDVVHFTTFVIRGVRNRDPSYYYGRCLPVNGVLEYRPTYPSPPPPWQPWEFDNHPENDDGDATNNVGCSRSAEVMFFVRNGNLYRRVLLVRDTDLAGQLNVNSAQPSSSVTSSFFSNRLIPAYPGQSSYYKSFDYAAYCRVVDNTDPTTDSLRFLGIDALDNRADAAESLGRSMSRFGFAISSANQVATNGDPVIQAIIRARAQPVEFDVSGNFFGRPLHGETCSYQWQWPGTRVNPLLDGTLAYNSIQNRLYVGGSPIVDPDTVGSREIEDLLLPNVEAFDVEVWDPGLHEDLDGDGIIDAGEDLNGNNFLDQAEGFVQLGTTTLSTGYFNSAQRLNTTYGPGEYDANGNGSLDGTEDRNSNGAFDLSSVFDTGNPEMWADEPDRLSGAQPPYRPLLFRITEDSNRNGSLDMGEDLNSNSQLDRPVFPVRAADFWSASRQYQSGQVVFRQSEASFSLGYRCIRSGEDADGDGWFDVGEDLDSDSTLDWGTTGTNEPDWPKIPGQIVNDGSVRWQAFDNRVGLQKIRITVRVRDPIEGVPRQFSIIHSFVNPED